MASVLTYDGLLQELRAASLDVDEPRLRRAWDTAQEAYAGHMHWTGESVFDHVMGVLQTLLPYQLDEDAIVACLLHHVLKCRFWSLIELEQQFGPQIRSLVSGIHLLSHVTLRDRRSSIEDLRLMLLTVSDDIRTILIVLCDRSYLLSRAGTLARGEAQRVAQDVLQLFAPVAARLGIYTLKYGLESMAFPILYPQDAERLNEQMQKLHEQYGDCLVPIAETIQNFLASEGVRVAVEAREKQLYSVFIKMREKSITHVLDLYDLFAVRVIVDSEAECYQVLGLLHKIGRPVANRFKDYIAFPKPNGYQSLHTTLANVPGMALKNMYVEVQVRTVAMHREAQYGIAAHWMYKERGSQAAKAVERVQLKSVLAAQQSLGESEGVELADNIFVLTPRGDIVELPEGATPLDFAFQLHTDLGLCFRAARVNGSIVPLTYRLENGDIVEVLKRKTPAPSPQWLQLLRMASSRSKLKRFLYAQDRATLVARGRYLVNLELKKRDLPPLDAELSLLRVCDGHGLTAMEREDVLFKIGQGAERAASILMRIDLPHVPSLQQERNVPDKTFATLDIGTEENLRMPLRHAKCCKPHEGDRSPIVGIISRSGAVMIHRETCRLSQKGNPERRIRVWWQAKNAKREPKTA